MTFFTIKGRTAAGNATVIMILAYTASDALLQAARTLTDAVVVL